MRLGGILPSVLSSVPSLEGALAIRSALAARRHGVLVVDPLTVTPAADMPRVRRFTIAEDRFHLDDRGNSIGYSEIAALVRAITTTAVVRKVTEREPVYTGPGRPPAMEAREHMRHESAESNLLYIVPAKGPPTLMVARDAKYLSLGKDMRATEHDNFLLAIERLREAAPHAFYDERFASRAHHSRKLTVTRGSDRAEAKSDGELDLLVHALARWLTRGSGSPYRDD
jgi:hypothetical protein